MTVHAGCVKVIFKILDFYNVKSYAFDKLATLATISKKNVFIFYSFLDRHTYLFIYICIIDV